MDLSVKHCVLCEGGTPSFTQEQEDVYMKETPSWMLNREQMYYLQKRFTPIFQGLHIHPGLSELISMTFQKYSRTRLE
jgi:hypothetical protein